LLNFERANKDFDPHKAGPAYHKWFS